MFGFDFDYPMDEYLDDCDMTDDFYPFEDADMAAEYEEWSSSLDSVEPD